MLDHVFTDAIGALRDALEQALLERQAFEEHLQSDVLLGDLTWETSYGLPGEGSPPRIRADLSLDWPTWAQSAYRSWYIGEDMDEGPRIEISIVLRVQRLTNLPSPEEVFAALPSHSPTIGGEQIHRHGITVETTYDDDLANPSHAVEVVYDGSYELDENSLEDGSILDTHFGALGGWISHTLVRLGDVKFEFFPPDDHD